MDERFPGSPGRVEIPAQEGVKLRERWASVSTLEDPSSGRRSTGTSGARCAGTRGSAPRWRRGLRSLQAPRHLLDLLEDWRRDAVNTVPVPDRLATEVTGLELRVLRRDENADLMDAHPSGTARAIPVVIVPENFRELGWWGSRPAPLAGLVRVGGGTRLDRTDQYPVMRRGYARDRGRPPLREIAALFGATAEEDGEGVAPPRVA